MHGRRGALARVAIVACVMAGCSSDDDPTAQTTTSDAPATPASTQQTTTTVRRTTTTTTLVTALPVVAPAPTRAVLLGAVDTQDQPLDANVSAQVTQAVVTWVQAGLVDPTVTGVAAQLDPLLTENARFRLTGAVEPWALLAAAPSTEQLSAAGVDTFGVQLDAINGLDGFAALATATVDVSVTGTSVTGAAVSVKRRGTLTFAATPQLDGTTRWLLDSFVLEVPA
jgi:hypothetical protein